MDIFIFHYQVIHILSFYYIMSEYHICKLPNKKKKAT